MKYWLSLPFVAVALGPAWAAKPTEDKYNITVAEHAACDNDAIALCSDAYPDQDKMLMCMRAKTRDLSSGCRIAFEAGLKRRHMH
jgi:hypothetical protein